MNGEEIKGVINITNLDTNDRFVNLEGSELDVSKEVMNGLKFLAKSITGESGDAFSFRLPEGVSGALSKVFIASAGLNTPLADIVSLISVAACRYFFSIHSQLEDINNKLSEIINFLMTDKLCELESQLKFLRYSYDNYEYIVTNERQCLATVVQIQATKKVALQNVLFYERFLSRHLHKSSNSKSALIDEANKFLENAENYRYSAELYCISLIMELIFSQNYNKNLILNVKKEISDTIKSVDKNLYESVGAMKKALDSKKFNKDFQAETRSKIYGYKDMSEREGEYNAMLDKLSEQINTSTELIIKNNSLYIK